MRLKQIAALPVPECKKTGNIIAAQICGDTLVIDCWKNKQYKGRYCIETPSGKYRHYISGIWCQLKFRAVFDFSWYDWSEPKNLGFLDKASKKIAEPFIEDLAPYSSVGFVRNIENIETAYQRDLRDRAHDRKCERIRKLMEKVPTVPVDFEGWALRVPFKDKDYMFFDKASGKYFCTACGKVHNRKKGKHNEMTLCSRTGKQVQIKCRQHDICAKEHIMLLQKIDNESSVARHFTCAAHWNSNGKRVIANEDVRLMLPRYNAPCTKIFYGQYRQRDEFHQHWWDSNPTNRRASGRYCYPFGVEQALEGTVYCNCGIEHMAQMGLRLQYNNIMLGYNYNLSALEYLVKGRFYKLLDEESNLMSWGHYYGDLCFDGKTDTEVLRLDKQRVNRLRQNNGGHLYWLWMRYEKKKDIRIPEETVGWLIERALYPKDLNFIEEKMSVVKICNYLQKQKDTTNEPIKQLLTTWRDYFSMAKRLDMNLDAEQIFKPKDLSSAHAELINRINQNADKKEAQAMARKFPDANKVMKTLNIYEWGDSEYVVKAPKGIVDIIREGRALSHCVGTSERYYDRIATRESYILFLRRADQPDKPFYTLEVEPGGTIRQKRTTGDKQTKDIKQAKEFLAKWQKVIHDRLSDSERELAKKSKTLRIEEFNELRKNGNRIHNGILAGQLLVDVLEKDLMEIETEIA